MRLEHYVQTQITCECILLNLLATKLTKTVKLSGTSNPNWSPWKNRKTICVKETFNKKKNQFLL